jgi:tRNA (mo5U34)-methyltransferase
MPPVSAKWTEQAIRERLAGLTPWFHNMQLGGVWTAPEHFLGDYPAVKWRHVASTIPADLSGKTVLDIGCNAGFYSFEMKKRGAARVLGLDWDPQYLAQARFAAEVLELDVEFRQMSVWQIGELAERFDLVLFLGVFYHLRHPLLALDLIHEHVSKDMLLFQTMQRGDEHIAPVAPDYRFEERAHFNRSGYPKMHFIEHSYSGDSTNWWTPNRACVEAMLRSAGFRIEAHPEAEVYFCRWQPISEAADGPRAVYPATGPRHEAS